MTRKTGKGERMGKEHEVRRREREGESEMKEMCLAMSSRMSPDVPTKTRN